MEIANFSPTVHLDASYFVVPIYLGINCASGPGVENRGPTWCRDLANHSGKESVDSSFANSESMSFKTDDWHRLANHVFHIQSLHWCYKCDVFCSLREG